MFWLALAHTFFSGAGRYLRAEKHESMLGVRLVVDGGDDSEVGVCGGEGKLSILRFFIRQMCDSALSVEAETRRGVERRVG